MDFDAARLDEREIADVELLAPYLASDTITWIDVRGMGDEAVMRRLGALLDLHPLALEDIVNVPQRPKREAYDDYELIVSRMVRVDPPDFDVEQVAIVVGRGYVATFQERDGDVFDPVRERLRRGGGPIRRYGGDYLAYCLLDAILDGYYPVLEGVGDFLSDLEDAVLARPTSATLQEIHRSKHLLSHLRRAVWPQREMVNALVRGDSERFSEPVRVYLRDCYDHAVQILDIVETYRELTAGLMDVYLSTISNRTNEVMKTLTIMGSIFIPLTFVAGIYGMNFEHMPELHSRWAYPVVWLLMLAIAGALLFHFWRRGWIGGGEQAARDGKRP
jgi:magnesium transporter